MIETLKKPNTNPSGVLSTSAPDVPGIVRGVIDDIRQNGDKAVRSYSEKFDNWSPQNFKLSEKNL
jgi:histidinol dehydrogenase